MWEVEKRNISDSGLHPASFCVWTLMTYLVCGWRPLMLYANHTEPVGEDSAGEEEAEENPESVAFAAPEASVSPPWTSSVRSNSLSFRYLSLALGGLFVDP